MAVSDPEGEIKPAIRAYVLSKLDARGLSTVADDASLVEFGVVDSLGVFQLVAFLEDTFRIRVHDEDIRLDHFESIEATTRFVERKRGSPRA